MVVTTWTQWAPRVNYMECPMKVMFDWSCQESGQIFEYCKV